MRCRPPGAWHWLGNHGYLLSSSHNCKMTFCEVEKGPPLSTPFLGRVQVGQWRRKVGGCRSFAERGWALRSCEKLVEIRNCQKSEFDCLLSVLHSFVYLTVGGRKNLLSFRYQGHFPPELWTGTGLVFKSDLRSLTIVISAFIHECSKIYALASGFLRNMQLYIVLGTTLWTYKSRFCSSRFYILHTSYCRPLAKTTVVTIH